jgi:hypothetical protein
MVFLTLFFVQVKCQIEHENKSIKFNKKILCYKKTILCFFIYFQVDYIENSWKQSIISFASIFHHNHTFIYFNLYVQYKQKKYANFHLSSSLFQYSRNDGICIITSTLLSEWVTGCNSHLKYCWCSLIE